MGSAPQSHCSKEWEWGSNGSSCSQRNLFIQRSSGNAQGPTFCKQTTTLGNCPAVSKTNSEECIVTGRFFISAPHPMISLETMFKRQHIGTLRKTGGVHQNCSEILTSVSNLPHSQWHSWKVCHPSAYLPGLLANHSKRNWSWALVASGGCSETFKRPQITSFSGENHSDVLGPSKTF